MSENTDLTYYKKNRDVTLNREIVYYENNKDKLRAQARDKYRNLSDDKQNKKNKI